MQLIYDTTGKPVKINERVRAGDAVWFIDHFAEPRTIDGEGKVTLRTPEQHPGMGRAQFDVSAIGAKWIGRGDAVFAA